MSKFAQRTSALKLLGALGNVVYALFRIGLIIVSLRLVLSLSKINLLNICKLAGQWVNRSLGFVTVKNFKSSFCMSDLPDSIKVINKIEQF